MAGVFISYRREDSPGHAGRVFDRVRAKFGADVVFMDVTALDAGVDFIEAIDKAVGTCDVLLAIIGPQWVAAADRAGHRRLDNPTDFVRLEIAGALKRQVRVVPVLVDGAQLPAAADLPEELQPLLRRNALELRDARWDADVDQLLSSLERIVKPREEPLRLEAPPHRWLAKIAALAVVILAGGAAAVFGPRACAPRSDEATRVAQTPTQAAAPAGPVSAPATGGTVSAPAPKPVGPPAGGRPSPKPRPAVPALVGRSLSDARLLLRTAGVELASTTYVEDRAKAPDEVLSQAEVPAARADTPAVALTVAARATVVVSHRANDADAARGLVAALRSSRAAAGLVIRANETAAVRPEALGRVVYSDPAFADTAADLAKDASAWLRQIDARRPSFTSGVYERVGARILVIGVPSSGITAPATGPLPDVRGHSLATARRMLTDAGVATVNYKWLEDRAQKPLAVVGQTEIPERAAGSRAVVLDVVAKATLFVEYTESDRPTVERLARDLRANRMTEGIVVRLQPVRAVKTPLIGKIVSGESLAGDAAATARLASSWLTKELGRAVPIQPVTDAATAPRTLLFGVPKL